MHLKTVHVRKTPAHTCAYLLQRAGNIYMYVGGLQKPYKHSFRDTSELLTCLRALRGKGQLQHPRKCAKQQWQAVMQGCKRTTLPEHCQCMRHHM